MKAKINFSLSLKLTLIAVLLATFVTIALVYIEVQQINQFSQISVKDYVESHQAIKEFEDYVTKYYSWDNTSQLNEYVFDISKRNPYVSQININLPAENGLAVAISTDNESIGKKVGYYDNLSYTRGDSFFILDENNPILTIVSPINISGNIIGTYNLVISMQSLTTAQNTLLKDLVLISFVFILILIFSLLYLLRRIIVKPIIALRDTSVVIGKGNLDTRVDIDTRDELGDLASAFNQMAKDLKESRDKIQDYNKILENLLDRKDEFIGQLGHDLKNPLQPLVALLPMLIEEEKDPKTREALEIMNKNVEYMRDLIFETLQLAKLRSADVKFDFENVKLREEAEGCVESQKLLLKERNIMVDNKIGDNIVVYADKLRLVEVFKNLISNAVKYTSEGGGMITLDAHENEDMVTVSINDTGIGIAQEQLNKMFDEFYKADRFSSDYHSTGLGLAICKRIIEKHGGRIWVESPGLGKGSTFYFTLKKGKEK